MVLSPFTAKLLFSVCIWAAKKPGRIPGKIAECFHGLTSFLPKGDEQHCGANHCTEDSGDAHKQFCAYACFWQSVDLGIDDLQGKLKIFFREFSNKGVIRQLLIAIGCL